LFNPLVGIPNDIKVLFLGEDIYGNKANNFDQVMAGLSIVTFGAAKYFEFGLTGTKEVVKTVNNLSDYYFPGYSALGVANSNK